MRILVTGAAGYLAGFIVDLLGEEHELTLTDHVELPEGRLGGAFVKADITDYDAVAAACAGHDAVVHTVALVRERFDKPPTLFADVMVKGTWNVAEACARQGVKRLVNISSVIAIGSPEVRSRPYRVGYPQRYGEGDLYYCLAKHLGEEIGRAYHQAHGLSVVHIRPGVIAGDGLNREPVAPDDPNRPWFMHVSPIDVAAAVRAALESDVEYGAYHAVTARRDGVYDFSETQRDLGHTASHNWPDIPEGEVKP
jgi:NAD+ dependent glucose-6-phosphate dehydrogenase